MYFSLKGCGMLPCVDRNAGFRWQSDQQHNSKEGATSTVKFYAHVAFVYNWDFQGFSVPYEALKLRLFVLDLARQSLMQLRSWDIVPWWSTSIPYSNWGRFLAASPCTWLLVAHSRSHRPTPLVHLRSKVFLVTREYSRLVFVQIYNPARMESKSCEAPQWRGEASELSSFQNQSSNSLVPVPLSWNVRVYPAVFSFVYDTG